MLKDPTPIDSVRRSDMNATAHATPPTLAAQMLQQNEQRARKLPHGNAGGERSSHARETLPMQRLVGAAAAAASERPGGGSGVGGGGGGGGSSDMQTVSRIIEDILRPFRLLSGTAVACKWDWPMLSLSGIGPCFPLVGLAHAFS
jgi:hypothetical protein